MAMLNQFKAVIKCPTPNELFQKHQAAINAAPSASTALRDIVFNSILEALLKLRISKLSSLPLDSSDVQTELMHALTLMLHQAQKGDKGASMNFSFEVSNDSGMHKRTVNLIVSLTASTITVMGVEPVPGRPGFIREKGGYAKERLSRKQTSGKVDHFLTGNFSQTQQGELLAIIDNTKLDGTAGIDVRGTIVKPTKAAKYLIEIGSGIERKETDLGKIELFSKGHGVVRASYDGDDFLRKIDVETSIKLGEVGLRSGGHVMARGKSGKVEALSLAVAEFRTVPIAFEARTQGAIIVKESVQGIVHGASIVAEMVNQAPGKFMVATEDSITINRTLQGGFLYAPTIVVGNKKVSSANVMHTSFHARNKFTGRNINFSGHNELVLGNDFFKEPEGAGSRQGSSAASGQNLFANRKKIGATMKRLELEFEDLSASLNTMLTGQVKSYLSARQNMTEEMLGKVLTAVGGLDSSYMQSLEDEEPELRKKLANTLSDIGITNNMLLLKRFAEKRELYKELQQAKGELAAMTQDISAEFSVNQWKEGALLTVRCWQDELTLQAIGNEMLVTRTAKNERLFSGPAKQCRVNLNFNYATGLLDLLISQ